MKDFAELRAAYTVKAERGADLLDQRVPRWAEQIDIESLNLDSWVNCVLAQIFGDYSPALEALELNGKTGADEHGFYIDSSAPEYGILTNIWRRLIAERLTSYDNA